MHPVLMVQSPPGLLYVNGRFCGEAEGSCLPLARDGAAYVEYRPIGSTLEAVTLKLALKRGVLDEGLPEGVYAVQWPNGLIEVELHGETAAVSPQQHATLATGLGLLELFEQGDRLYLGLEKRSTTELPVVGPYSDLQMRTQQHPTMPLVVVTGVGEQGPFTLIFRLEDPPLLLQCVQGLAANWTSESAGHTPAYSPQEISRSWLEAVHEDRQDEAARMLLQPSLQAALSRQVAPFDEIVQLKYPVPGLAPVEWGVLRLSQPQVARVQALGFTGKQSGEQWRIERVIPY